MNKLSWSFSNIWNESLLQREERELKPRDHIWASELGGAFIDRWYKMKAEEPSNPFDARSLRKFEAGRVFEWIVEMVLSRAGILQSTQDWVDFQYPGLMRVTGKLDHLAGGSPDWEKAKAEFSNGELPDFIKRAASAVVKHFSEKYPDGLKLLVLEIKSVGSNMFHKYDVHKLADTKHALQLYHYLKGKNIPEGHIVYVSKDDLCLVEIGVIVGQYEDKYHEDIEKMTEYFKGTEPPPAEQPVGFDELGGRFSVNWKISYSPYLTKVYGFKNQAEFEGKYKALVARWNRVLGRVADGKPMTDDNKKALEDMRKDFPNLDELVEIAKDRRFVEKGGEKNG